MVRLMVPYNDRACVRLGLTMLGGRNKMQCFYLAREVYNLSMDSEKCERNKVERERNKGVSDGIEKEGKV